MIPRESLRRKAGEGGGRKSYMQLLLLDPVFRLCNAILLEDISTRRIKIIKRR